MSGPVVALDVTVELWVARRELVLTRLLLSTLVHREHTFSVLCSSKSTNISRCLSGLLPALLSTQLL
jgi:hypothetical protein